MHEEPGSRSRYTVILSLVWFLTGTLGFGVFALLAFAINPFATDSVFEPESYRLAVMLWHLPMMWGWVPPAVRAARKRPEPWRKAKWTILLGICIGPLIFLAIVGAIRVVMQASASV